MDLLILATLVIAALLALPILAAVRRAGTEVDDSFETLVALAV